ncbi:MAG: methyltransferase domain-containing protein [Methanoregula sp.]|nr:methyltransferase domain-containing protein [Methanoregula sp.]
MTDETTRHRSIRAECLEGRIQENTAAQTTDFNAWVFNRIPVNSGDRVLELCCGTGAQTLHFLRRTGKTGRVVALDIATESLNVLHSKVPNEEQICLTLIESDLDLFDKSLTSHGISQGYFDMIFCSYGLYYSNDASIVLARAKLWLKPGGSLVIVGPFGPNNEPLYRLLAGCGVEISDYIRFTSQDFMNKVVIPVGALHFNSLTIRTLVNTIVWNSAEHVFTYWKNTTFYDECKKDLVQAHLDQHFETQSAFINEKWVMLVIMHNE